MIMRLNNNRSYRIQKKGQTVIFTSDPFVTDKVRMSNSFIEDCKKIVALRNQNNYRNLE
jgi:hypothetical protein